MNPHDDHDLELLDRNYEEMLAEFHDICPKPYFMKVLTDICSAWSRRSVSSPCKTFSSSSAEHHDRRGIIHDRKRFKKSLLDVTTADQMLHPDHHRKALPAVVADGSGIPRQDFAAEHLQDDQTVEAELDVSRRAPGETACWKLWTVTGKQTLDKGPLNVGHVLDMTLHEHWAVAPRMRIVACELEHFANYDF